MIATKLHIEFYHSENALFERIDDILKKNGLYNIDFGDRGFILSYWFGFMYEVQDSKFRLKVRLGTPNYGRDVQPIWGDILVLDAVSFSQSWFYFPKLLIGRREKWIIRARGYTPLGNAFSLVKAGILRPIKTSEEFASFRH